MNIHRSDESNSEIQALSDIPLLGTYRTSPNDIEFAKGK
jgi:hypothetical protein